MMANTAFFVIAVGLGTILLLAIVWTYLSGTQRPASVSLMLALLGFVLVGSPLWASIVVKSGTVEISVYRQCQEEAAKSAEQTAQLLATVQAQAPPEKARELAPLVEQAQRSVLQLQQPSVPPKEHARILTNTVRDLETATKAAREAVRANH